jgi:ATP-binding protein involved in chromosome partitioning
LIATEIKPFTLFVGSAKGGVGKSTVTLGLAKAMQRRGVSVGVIDADIHGPSLLTLANFEGRHVFSASKKIVPLIHEGIQYISIGAIVPQYEAIAWRGVMAQRAVLQFLKDVDFNAIDVILIDLPPGTSDIHFAVCQQTDPKAAILVSTPDQVGVNDTVRFYNFLKRMSIDVCGIIYNMTHMSCPSCRHTIYLHDTHHSFPLNEVKILHQLPWSKDLSSHFDHIIQELSHHDYLSKFLIS